MWAHGMSHNELDRTGTDQQCVWRDRSSGVVQQRFLCNVYNAKECLQIPCLRNCALQAPHQSLLCDAVAPLQLVQLRGPS